MSETKIGVDRAYGPDYSVWHNHRWAYDKISDANVCSRCGVSMSDRSQARPCYGRGNPFGPPKNTKEVE